MESNVTSNEQQIAHLASTPPQTMVNTYVVRSKAAVWYIPQSYKCHSNSLGLAVEFDKAAEDESAGYTNECTKKNTRSK